MPDQPTIVRKNATPERTSKIDVAEACEIPKNTRSGNEVGARLAFSCTSDDDTGDNYSK
jgi:hypothetical protein